MTKQKKQIQQTSSPSRLVTQLTRRLLSLLVGALLANCASAQTSDNNWTSVGNIPGADGPVYATVVDGAGNLYIGGAFTKVGDVVANGIAKWNGSSWLALGSGLNGPVFTNVFALAVSGSDVYAGGTFRTAGGTSANNIAKWNGSSWSALSSGVDASVMALTIQGTNLYAGGNFKTAGGSAANYIAKWNGSSWSALGSGMDSSVLTLAVSGSDVYAGGWFTKAGGNTVNYVAKWNGSSWSALASTTYDMVFAGMNDPVDALVVSGSDLYAGGSFTTAGGNAATNIAKWNGSSWSGVGSGIDSQVNALAVSGCDLYAGGWFTHAGGAPANRIAKWNGSSWTALGWGMNDTVRTLAVSGGDLYAGGAFNMAGANQADGIAMWKTSSRSYTETKLTASDGFAGDQFGRAVGVSGNTMVVGAAGAAYVFVRDAGKWVQQAKLTTFVSQYTDFGKSVAISGDRIVVGAPDSVGAPDDGAYVFIRNGTQWVQQAKLTATDLPQDGFGESVAIYKNIVLIGARRAKAPQTIFSVGRVYTNSLPDSFGTLSGTPIFEPGTNIDANFGASVALGPFFPYVIGAPEQQDAGFSKGAVNLSDLGKLHGDAGDDFFGEQVAVSGNTLLVAASSGVYVFVCDDPNHPSLSRLQARLYGDWLADAFDPPNKIAISGDTAAIGWSKEGIFVYTRCGTNWSLAPAALKASDGAGFLTVALDGNTIAGGAPGYFAVPGAVYVYEPTRPRLINPVKLANGSFQFTFANPDGLSFTVLATTDLSLPLSNWTALGSPVSIGGGLYQFTDSTAVNYSRRFYQLRSP